MLNRKLVMSIFVLMLCMMLIFLPIYSVFGGWLNPSFEHVKRAENHLPNSNLLQVGFDSGSYSCVNGECDYSNTYDLRQYISIPSANKIVTIHRSFKGEWTVSVEEITLKLWLSLTAIYALAIVGVYFSVRVLKRV
ncbi:hypothetical protein TW85_23080 [Marinomonas sp. S3726]|uniref:hypothetical protein n=1 Tax=Marinomonas sp. S3726 TaxID=579484 RepID=UPI0005FA5268|nr:hypothetical protein [Marinomonas sp. S3726]KJZ08919.1 hypothetical protein TW85_23080 [Marinomonas sp. S3726]